MSQIILADHVWTALHATAARSEARAQAFAGKLPVNGKLILSRLGVTLRTITVGAWTVGAQRVDGRWPITPGAFTDPGTGAGIPDWAEFRDATDAFVCGMPAGVGSGVLQLLTELVAGQPLAPGVFTLTSLGFPPANPPPPSGKDWYPGHYIYLTENVDYTGIIESRRDYVKANPFIRGYHCIHQWAQIETSKGVYDWSTVESDLDKAATDGKVVIVRMMERRFVGDRPFPLPAYIVDEYDGAWVYDTSKVMPKFWDERVAERMYLWLESLFSTLGTHEGLHGVFWEESSMGNSSNLITDQPGYTHAKAADYWLGLSERGSAASGKNIFMMNMNWGYSSSATPTRAELLETMAVTHKAGLGATDARMPGDRNGAATSYSFQSWVWAGTTSLTSNVEWNTYATDSARPTRTARDYLDFGVDTLGLTHMGWEWRESGTLDFNIYDAIAEINRQGGRINSDRPTNFPAS